MALDQPRTSLNSATPCRRRGAICHVECSGVSYLSSGGDSSPPQPLFELSVEKLTAAAIAAICLTHQRDNKQMYETDNSTRHLSPLQPPPVRVTPHRTSPCPVCWSAANISSIAQHRPRIALYESSHLPSNPTRCASPPCPPLAMSVFNVDVSVLGQSLTTPQRVAIKNALYKLQINSRIPGTLAFWGKVLATQHDYLIAAATTLAQSIDRSYYYSVDGGVTFAVLPAVDEWVEKTAPLVTGLFTGNPALKYRDPTRPVKTNEDGEAVEDEDDEEAAEAEQADGEDKTEDAVKKPKERRLTEEERLSYTVAAIDRECALQPTGLTMLAPTGHIATDPTFSGLSVHQLPLLASYSHLRNPTSASALARQRKQRTANCAAYLDRVEGDEERQWAVNATEGGLEVGLRSLVWLGWEYRVRASEREGRGGYFGYGERNNDLHFML